jgi:SSS family solute:Na+ symporter
LAVDTPVALKDTVFFQKIFGQFPGYAEGSFLWIINKTFFQYYSLAIFLISAVVMIVVSYLTKAPPEAKIEGLTYATLSEKDREVSRASWNFGDVAASALVLVAILAAYLYFTG